MNEIKGFPNYYVTECGKVFTQNNGVMSEVKARPINSTGHLAVCLYANGKKHVRTVHSLVIESYVRPRPQGLECRHLDGNPKNNHVSNLAWGTRKENVADMKRHGTLRVPGLKGMSHYNSKLSDEDILSIRSMKATGSSWSAIAQLFAIHERTVRKIVSRERWAHVA